MNETGWQLPGPNERAEVRSCCPYVGHERCACERPWVAYGITTTPPGDDSREVTR